MDSEDGELVNRAESTPLILSPLSKSGKRIPYMGIVYSDDVDETAADCSHDCLSHFATSMMWS